VNEPENLPEGPFEREILIQDRQFDTHGQVLFPDGAPAGLNGSPPNPSVHPFWNPEFFGDVIVVNGKAWPFLTVEPRRYRFRLLNGSNARMYHLELERHLPFWQIGTDGGYLEAPVKTDHLFLAPGERADVVVDFTDLPEGTTVLMTNHAKAPFPHGTPPDPHTTGQIMQFRVVPLKNTDTSCKPPACQLRRHPIVRLAKNGAMTVIPATKRTLILRESEGPGGPLEVTLNNTKWMGIKESTLRGSTPTPVSGSGKVGHNWVTELPRIGSTEEWDIINTTEDAHPIHLHLIQFQVINRQAFMANAYPKGNNQSTSGDGPPNDYQVPNADGAVGGNFAVSSYLQGRPLPPDENETGWKDTVVMLPGTVTRLAVRWAPQSVPVDAVRPGQNRYSFNPAAALGTVDGFGFPGGLGYVWHCHILDHEDNEMMRPLMVLP
jgi:FtsP/CotA-like multicopper oxidase with cupredoxin domain